MRGKAAKPRDIKPDPKFGNVLLAKFINNIMQRGKKTVAQGIVYEALIKVEELSKKDPVKIFEEAVKSIAPQVEVRSRRVGGANYQVPMPVRGGRQNALAFRWIIDAARNKKGQPMAQKLATILFETSQGTGDAMKKRDDMHRMAEANKAFAHFARFSK
ncbi:MAG: 30S ribosomal protein S7 [Candidatus Magasanikbacteria bacterium RIFCSPLOWO2_02_FULL_44_11]|uniref:Small ribosomal subunit protein uS7 n=1 Tax=Candidatus Magasanikbacteria bacterium RIFCSPLOWO2_02_FULL_44_11 TaxID=1798689 RepID=A0A1F6NBS6_9BACT|nr:MAG: 30S ribosomal protein S7 [Candidatus Magasanikbacteria bacterium RIFCSPLOWO2_02_FULL_44_11]